jgi:hypothetical protein
LFAFFAEFDDSISQRKKGVILTDAYILTGVVLCTTLAHNDVTCNATLSAKNFDTQPFRL